MAASLGEIINQAGPTSFNFLSIGIWVMIGLFVLALFISVIGIRVFLKRRWNIIAIIKIPRSDGNFLITEVGKAHYNHRKSKLYIKRPGKGAKKITHEMVDPKKYVQGDNLMEFILLGPDQVMPIGPDSYQVVKDSNGEEMAVMKVKTDFLNNKSWYYQSIEEGIDAFTIKSLLQQFQTPIAIAIVLIACFVGFAILWTKLSSVC